MVGQMPIEILEAEKKTVKTVDPFFEQRREVENNLGMVKKVVAIHSGKGGVGKSTFAVNLSAFLSLKGFRTGLMDSDVDCPSLHLMCGLEGARVFANESMRLVPLESSFGIKLLSVGNMVESDSIANVMRGPIMFKLIFDMLSKAEWNSLDFLIIDLPPGTGDNALTVMQLAPLFGLIVVTQPQKATLAEAEKSIDMAKRIGVNVLGVVENMAGSVFGQVGANEIASKHKTVFAGTIPLDSRIREAGDKGMPAVVSYKDVAENFENIASKLGLL